jgi:hypothetical protein
MTTSASALAAPSSRFSSLRSRLRAEIREPRVWILGAWLFVLSTTGAPPSMERVNPFLRFLGWTWVAEGQGASLHALAFFLLIAALIDQVRRQLWMLLACFAVTLLTGLWASISYHPIHGYHSHVHVLPLLVLGVATLWSRAEEHSASLLQCISGITGLTYFLAAVEKLGVYGADWVDGERLWVAFQEFHRLTPRAESALNLWLRESSWESPIWMLAACGILLFEVSVGWALWSRRARPVAAILALGFHASVWWFLEINFFWAYAVALLPLCSSWINDCINAWSSRNAT